MENFESLMRIREIAQRAETAGKRPGSTGGFAPRQPKKQPKIGATCPDCWTKKSLTGECECTL